MGLGGDLRITTLNAETAYLLNSFDARCLRDLLCVFTVQCDASDGGDVSFENLVGLPSSQEGFFTYSVPPGGPYTSCLLFAPDTFQTVQYDNIVFG